MALGWYWGPYAYSDPTFPDYDALPTLDIGTATVGVFYTSLIDGAAGSSLQLLTNPNDSYSLSQVNGQWFINGTGLVAGQNVILLTQSGRGVRTRTLRLIVTVAA